MRDYRMLRGRGPGPVTAVFLRGQQNDRPAGRRVLREFKARRPLLKLFGMLGTVCLAVLLPALPVAGCQICVPLPTATIADRLLESDVVALAGEDPDRPFHFRAREVIKGKLDDAAIDLFMGSSNRRKLHRDPDANMVLARKAGEGSWIMLGMADEPFISVVHETLAAADRWRPGETDNLERVRYFAAFLGHQDKRLHQLAYLEVGRAPYSMIREMAAMIPASVTYDMLDMFRYIEWRRLAILLLGESPRIADGERVVRKMVNIWSTTSSRDLSAWATAYIAVRGQSGISDLDREYFQQQDRHLGEVQQVLQALSVHGNEFPQLRSAIVAAYRSALLRYPETANTIAFDLTSWERWELAGDLASLSDGTASGDPLADYPVRLYLRMAGSRMADPLTAQPLPELSQ